MTRSRGVLVDEYAVDPGRDFLIARYEVLNQGKTIVSIDINYAAEPRVGWMPSAWHTIFLGPSGNLIIDHKGRVTACAVGERPDPSSFELPFPPRTWVRDDSLGESYIVKDDGGERRIAKGEMRPGITFNDLIKSEPGMAGVSRAPAWRSWTLTIAVGVFLASIMTLFVRRLRAAA